MNATYTKLKDGNWGLRIQGITDNLNAVTVTKKSGEIKTEYVGRILWRGNGIMLATIAKAKRQTRREIAELESRRGPGYCHKCHSYCYGDCK